MDYTDYSPDRHALSTDNNEFAEGVRDETRWDSDLVDIDIATDDVLSNTLDEDLRNDRPLYDEEGFRHNTGE